MPWTLHGCGRLRVACLRRSSGLWGSRGGHVLRAQGAITDEGPLAGHEQLGQHPREYSFSQPYVDLIEPRGDIAKAIEKMLAIGCERGIGAARQEDAIDGPVGRAQMHLVVLERIVVEVERHGHQHVDPREHDRVDVRILRIAQRDIELNHHLSDRWNAMRTGRVNANGGVLLSHSMPRTHTVAQGECLSQIARDHGFQNARTLWDHPANEPLRRQRRSPNVLHPGDQVVLPDHDASSVACGTGTLHNFQVRRPTKVLRLRLLLPNGTSVHDAPYVIEFDHEEIAGRVTDAQGRIEVAVPVGSRIAVLHVDGRVIHLRLNHLNPLDETPDEGVSGAQSRLRNLGYLSGAVDGRLDARTRHALAMFQGDQGLPTNGQPTGGTLAVLAREHGC